MCQVAHCALCVMCTAHVHNPGPWPSVWQGHWVPQAGGPIEFGCRGGGWAPQSQAWATNGAPNGPQLLHASSGGPVGAMGPLGCGPRCPHQPIVGPCHNPGGPHNHPPSCCPPSARWGLGGKPAMLAPLACSATNGHAPHPKVQWHC